MSLSQVQEQVIELSPQQRTKLQNRLLAIQKLRAQIDELKDELALKEADAEDIRAAVDAKTLDEPGYGRVTYVPEGTSGARLNEKMLLANGVPKSTIDKSKKSGKRKAYTLITFGGESPRETEQDDD